MENAPERGETAARQAAGGGLAAALVSYAIWGMMPIYWAGTAPALPLEVLSHRIVWAVAFIGAALLITGRGRALAAASRALVRDPRQASLILAAALFASLNWLVNILGAHTGRVVELGTGMFLTPLMTVLFGALFFHERLGGIRLAAVALAACGLAVMVFSLGCVPLIALGVSSTWAAYSAVKKSVRVNAVLSTGIEHALMLPFAAAYLAWLAGSGQGRFLAGDAALSLLLFGTGLVTAIPMVAYSYAAQRLPLSVLGFVQYLNPVLTICVGCLALGERLGPAQALALAFIVAGVALFAAAPRMGRKKADG